MKFTTELIAEKIIDASGDLRFKLNRIDPLAGVNQPNTSTTVIQDLNKLFKMSGRSEGKPISYIYLGAQYQFLKQMTYEQRISELSLNPDRADVIIPATKIYLSAMKWSVARKIFVPKIGLADGIIKSLFYF